MAKSKILIQLDTDAQPSVFDAVVAIDAEVDHLLRHASVTPQNVRDLVYGAIFTRGPDELHRTALFIGGSDVTAGERLLAAVRQTFFGPMRSVGYARFQRRQYDGRGCGRVGRPAPCAARHDSLGAGRDRSRRTARRSAISR